MYTQVQSSLNQVQVQNKTQAIKFVNQGQKQVHYRRYKRAHWPPRFVVMAMHPDAVRRRREFEERQKQTRKRLEEQRKGGWWSISGPSNMQLVQDMGQLKDAFQKHKLICVSYFSPECAACKAMHPKILKLAEQKTDVFFIKINALNPNMRPVFEAQGLSNVPYFQIALEGDILAGFSMNFANIGDLTRIIDDVYYKLIQSQKKQFQQEAEEFPQKVAGNQSVEEVAQTQASAS